MGVAHGDGAMIHFTGQVAWNELEEIVGPGNVTEQTEQCFENIKTVLKNVGGTLEHLVSVTTYFLDRSQLPLIQQVRSRYLGVENPPASTSIMVAGLGHEDFLVELAPIAVIPHDLYIQPD